MRKMRVRFLQDTLPQRCGKPLQFGFSFIIKHFFRPHYGNRLLEHLAWSDSKRRYQKGADDHGKGTPVR